MSKRNGEVEGEKYGNSGNLMHSERDKTGSGPLFEGILRQTLDINNKLPIIVLGGNSGYEVDRIRTLWDDSFPGQECPLVINTDRSIEALHKSQPTHDSIALDIKSLPFGETEIELLVALRVLHISSISNQEDFPANLSRLLAAGGKIITSVPTSTYYQGAIYPWLGLSDATKLAQGIHIDEVTLNEKRIKNRQRVIDHFNKMSQHFDLKMYQGGEVEYFYVWKKK